MERMNLSGESEGGRKMTMILTEHSVEKLALAKLFNEDRTKEVRREVVAGKYGLEFTARIRGSMKVGEDYSQNIPLKARPFLLASIFMSKVNDETLKAVMADYRKAIESLLQGGKEDGIKVIEEEVKPKVDRALDGLVAKTQTSCKGKVTLDIETFEIAN